MSDFAFRVSSKDRKLAVGEKVSPADEPYDPEASEYPDPLDHPEAFVQQYLQDYNSAKRNEEFTMEDQEGLDTLHSFIKDFFTTCSDPELGEDDLPGTKSLISLVVTDDGKNGISTFGSVEKESIAPLLPLIGTAAATLAPKVLPALKNAIPFAKRGLMWEGAQGILGALNPFDGGGGGGEQAAAPIQTTNYTIPARQATEVPDRFVMPVEHVTDSLMFEAASGPRKTDSDIEALRSQVNAALKEWAKSGRVKDYAGWWVYYSYAHEAETVAELQTILTAIPEDFHGSVLMSPVTEEELGEGNTGLPEASDPSAVDSTVSPADTSMSPVPVDGVGTAPKMPQNNSLIPGAMASHDKLKVRPVYAKTDESAYEDYAEEDRPVLARVASFIESGVHEQDIVETLYPSYGHEYVIWAVDQVQRVAAADPIVDPAVVNLGIEWERTSADKDPHDLPEGYHQMDIIEVLEDVENEKKKNKRAENNGSAFPGKGEHVGVNEDTKINQQADSNLITPDYEKTAIDYTAMPNVQQAQMAAQATGLPPNPATTTTVEDDMAQTEQMKQMYPNVPPEMAKNFVNQQAAPAAPTAPASTPPATVPVQNQPVQPSNPHPITPGVTPTPARAGLVPATTAKVAQWKDVNGDPLLPDRMYKMTSSDYEVPDYIRVLSNGHELEIKFPKNGESLTLDESEIKQSKYEFVPVEGEKESSFLSESTLTSFEQRELIDEAGVARNLDRLNLDGTHYLAFSATASDDTIELEEDRPYDNLYDLDRDLFL